jgi:hypothetical protein
MTLNELADTLPSGFHDCELKRLEVDYVARTIRLGMSILVGDPDAKPEQRDNVRDATVDISGLLFLIIDPPDHAPVSGEEIWIVDGYETKEILGYSKGIDPRLLESLPGNAFSYSFFVNDWNSYIHIAAKNCSLIWNGPERGYRGKRQHFSPGQTIDI